LPHVLYLDPKWTKAVFVVAVKSINTSFAKKLPFVALLFSRQNSLGTRYFCLCRVSKHTINRASAKWSIPGLPLHTYKHFLLKTLIRHPPFIYRAYQVIDKLGFCVRPQNIYYFLFTYYTQFLIFIYGAKIFKRNNISEKWYSIDILNYIKKIYSFSNVYIVYRIRLTIHVIVASVEKSLSKSKLIISYLRSTTCQQRLNEYFLLSIEK